MRFPMIRAWIGRRYVRLVCWMITRQLGGREIVVQKDGIDFDSGKFSGVFPVETAQGIRFVDEDDVSKGFWFDGRVSEDFKLTTGTWVSVGTLRSTSTTTTVLAP